MAAGGFDFFLRAAKNNFFDRKRVIRAMDRAQRKAFSKFGAFVMTRSRTSLKTRKGSSPPGTPPHSHVGLLKRGILFAWDEQKRSVVIGPVLIRANSRCPNVLEYGGIAARAEKSLLGQFRKKAKKPATYQPRPYMRPAFEKEKQVLGDLLRNSLR